MKPSFRRQRGIGLLSVLIGGVFFFLIAAVGTKLMPEVLGYFTVIKNVKGVVHDPGMAGASVAQIRAAYLKRIQVEGGSSVGPEDLEITKEGGEIIVTFAYSKKVPLFANVSLLIDFEGSSK